MISAEKYVKEYFFSLTQSLLQGPGGLESFVVQGGNKASEGRNH